MKKIGLSLIALATGLLAAEFAARALNPGTDVFAMERGMVRLSPDPEIRYELVPGFRSPSGDVSINRDGFRDHDWKLEKPDHVFRIACIGDSIAFGMGAPQDLIFSRQLEAAMNRVEANAVHPEVASAAVGADRPLSASFEVINFGVPGYNIIQVARTLETRVPPFLPDLVLYLYCFNDPQEYSRELENILSAPGVSAARRTWIERQWSQPPRWMPRSELWNMARLRFAARPRDKAAPADHSRDDMLQFLRGTGLEFYRKLYDDPGSMDRLRSGLARMKTWSRENDVPVVVTLMPVRSAMTRPDFKAFHDRVHDMVRQVGLETIDLLDVFRTYPGDPASMLFADPLHPNPEGYRLAAETVARQSP